MNIRLHIDRLVLDAVAVNGSSAQAVKAAVQSELTRLLTERGLRHDLQQGGAVPRVHAGTFAPTKNASARQLGTGIARSVYGGIGKGK